MKPSFISKNDLKKLLALGEPIHPTPDDFQNDSRTEESHSEFNAAMNAGEFMFEALCPAEWHMDTQEMKDLLTGGALYMISEAPGEWGQRRWSLGSEYMPFYYLELSATHDFAKVFKAPASLKLVNKGTAIQLEVGEINPARHIKAPRQATHFKLGITLVEVSDFIYNPETQWHECADEENLVYRNDTVPLPLNHKTIPAFTHTYPFTEAPQSRKGDWSDASPDYLATTPSQQYLIRLRRRPRTSHLVLALYILFLHYDGIEHRILPKGNAGYITEVK